MKNQQAQVKVLHVISGLSIGGAELMLYKLLAGIKNTLVNSRVVSLMKPGPVGKMIQGIGVDVDSLGFKKGKFSLSGSLKLVKIVREFKPEIIQSWLYHSDLLAFLTAKISMHRCKIVWNIRCSNLNLNEYGLSTLCAIKFCSFFSKYVDGILTNSITAKKYHLETWGYYNKLFKVIPNGFDVNVFGPDPQLRDKIRKELGTDLNSFCVGLINRFDPMKGYPDFLLAAKKVLRDIHKDQSQKIKFILAGRNVDWKNKELTDLIKKNELCDSVFLLGERTDVCAILNACDIMVSASVGEGFPNIIGEAMLCGLPCVVTDVGDSKMIVGNTGIVLPSHDPDALSQGIIDMILMNEEKRRGYGVEARKRIIDNYLIDKIVYQYILFYADLINS